MPLELDDEDYELLGYSTKFDLHELKKDREFSNYNTRGLRDPIAFKEYMKVYMREWRKNNPQKVKEIAARQRANPEYRAKQNKYYKRKKKRGTNTTKTNNPKRAK